MRHARPTKKLPRAMTTPKPTSRTIEAAGLDDSFEKNRESSRIDPNSAMEPETISESTRFREDLEADSLDLYTLVQELEDSYGITISDEGATYDATVRTRPFYDPEGEVLRS